MKIKNNMFLLVTFLVFLLMHTVVIFWFCQNTAGFTLTAATKFLPFILTVLYFGLYAFSRKANIWPLENFLLTYLGALFLAFCLTFALITITMLLKLFKVILPFNLGFIALGIWGIILLISLYTAAKTPKVTEITFDAPHLKRDIKIAFVSDTHFGATVGIKRAENLKKILEEQEPALILFGGDVFESDFEHSIPFAKILAKVPNKKFGVFGNHEYYQGLDNERASFKLAGINLLENKSDFFENINIIGINDIRTARITKQEFENILKQNIKPNNFNLLLTHTPLYFEEAANLGIHLMLSGHNHNGQIWPFNFMVKMSNPYLYGLFSYEKANLFVTSGTFFWGPPLRFLTNNEVTLIHLKGTEK